MSNVGTQHWRDALADRLGACAFTDARNRGIRPRIGAEVELLALDAVTGGVADVARAVLPMLRAHAAGSGWTQQPSAKGAPRFSLPAGGAVTFEPGGQIEYASPPLPTPAELLRDLGAVIPALVDRAESHGIRLLSAGIDPCNGIAAAPLQVESARYRRMGDYFDTIGPAGARMMRQTASVQVNVDAAADAGVTWRMLNAAAPYLTAIFANSARYAGAATGHVSYRARTWRLLDPSRTGVFGCADDFAEEYADFALSAPLISLRSGAGAYLPLQAWLECGGPSTRLEDEHLSTLFPEVRPKGYFEVRSIDAIPPRWYAAPVLLLAGITLDTAGCAAAAELLGGPDAALLARADRVGLADVHIADVARQLVDIAVTACERQGEEFCASEDLESAGEFFDRFTRQRRAPADES